MIKLFLLRHGKSSYDADTDFERGLKERGKNDSKNLSEFLLKENCLPKTILTSSAKRAYKTAKILIEHSSFDGEFLKSDDLYLASMREILSQIYQFKDSTASLMIVGHNPGLTELVNYFGIRLDNLPTCGLLCINFELNDYSKISPENAKFDFLHLPKYGKITL